MSHGPPANARSPKRRLALRRAFETIDGAEIIACLEPLVSDARQQRLRQVIGARLKNVTVVMDAPHDPHNGAAILRSCDAFGVYNVHVVERQERFSASGAVARGSQRWVDVITQPSVDAAVGALRKDGFTLVATHPDGELGPRDLADVERLALVMGNEHDGICQALTAACDKSVHVPMRGFVESLNVSVTAAILLAAATQDRPGDLDEMEKRQLYARGLVLTVPRALDVLAAHGIALPA
jgi:tRNA (guanosine-2'-O-)-methyltransferase